MEIHDAMTMAQDAIAKHNLIGWRFKWSNGVRIFGWCNYTTRTITLSRRLTAINTADRVYQTIIHEIAHALTPGHNHDDVWRAKAVALGHSGERCYTHNDTVAIAPTWKGTCPNCGKVSLRFRRKNIACGKCCNEQIGGKYDERFKIQWAKA